MDHDPLIPLNKGEIDEIIYSTYSVMVECPLRVREV